MDAATRKAVKYHHLLEQAQTNAQLITLQVGSQGVPDLQGFESLAASLSFSGKELVEIMGVSSRLALVGSFSILCSRNKSP